MKKLELLAPAGSKEKLIGAINAGADAVYLAGKRFGARAYANNFTDEEIIEVIHYAHMRGVFVYVTINTIIFNDEIDEFLSYADFLVKHHVDALIIQDLGMMYLLRRRYPKMILHASTQANAHDVDQVRFLKEIGINRVILARETPIDIIKKIKKEIDIEIEVFVQGALCVSFSGQCLMSSMLQKRSGNRGECAQPCRMSYALYKDGRRVSDQSYLLSTKDLMTLDYLQELIELGVESIKIEGRMRKAEYVIQAVLSYRHQIDAIYEHKINQLHDHDLDKLNRVFNRKFTKGFMFSEVPFDINHDDRPNHMGTDLGVVVGYQKNKVKIRLVDDLHINDGYRILSDKDYGDQVSRILGPKTIVPSAKSGEIIELDVKEPIKVGSKVIKTTDHMLEDELSTYLNPNYKKIAIKGKVIAYPNQKMVLELKFLDHVVIKESGDILEYASKHPTTQMMIVDQISKLGNTPFYFDQLDVKTDSQAFISVKLINQLRRDAISLLEEKMTDRIDQHIFCELEFLPVDLTYDEHLYYKITNTSQYHHLQDKYVDLIFDEKLKLNITKNTHLPIRRRIQLKQSQVITKPTYIHEVGSLLNHQNYPVYTTEFFNVTNIYSAYLLYTYGAKRVTLSLEIPKKGIEEFSKLFIKTFGFKPHLEMLVYGKMELMISRYCPIAKTYKTKPNCQMCEKNQYALRDIKNRSFDLIHDGACNIRIMSDQPLDLISEMDQLRQMGILSFRVDFTTEKEIEIDNIIRRIDLKLTRNDSFYTIGRYLD